MLCTSAGLYMHFEIVFTSVIDLKVDVKIVLDNTNFPSGKELLTVGRVAPFCHRKLWSFFAIRSVSYMNSIVVCSGYIIY